MEMTQIWNPMSELGGDDILWKIMTILKREKEIDALYNLRIVNKKTLHIWRGMDERELIEININNWASGDASMTPREIEQRQIIGNSLLECQFHSRSLVLDGYDAVTQLPNNIQIGGSFDIIGCNNLQQLPYNLFVNGDLNIRDCDNLQSMFPGLIVDGSMTVEACRLADLPDDIKVSGDLILKGCWALQRLPENLRFGHVLDISKTGIKVLPASIFDLDYYTNRDEGEALGDPVRRMARIVRLPNIPEQYIRSMLPNGRSTCTEFYCEESEVESVPEEERIWYSGSYMISPHEH